MIVENTTYPQSIKISASIYALQDEMFFLKADGLMIQLTTFPYTRQHGPTNCKRACSISVPDEV